MLGGLFVLDQKSLKNIKKSIDRALEESFSTDRNAAPIAAFDADGTLWNMDMGENFFSYQINNNLLPSLPKDPWAYYRTLHKKNEADAFLWLAQINKGQSEKQVRTWAKQAFEEIPKVPIFDDIKEVVEYLHKLKVKIYVVTASIKWAVEPGAEYLNIPAENVIGVKTRIEKNLITDILEGVVTWREGKVTGLLNSTNKKLPFFAAGNTMGDLPLLDSASDVRLIKSAAQEGESNFATEAKLKEIARSRGWFCF